MFFEVIRQDNGLGEIGLAISHNGLGWQYQQIVLSEPYHLSYPYVLDWNADFYMIPETSWTNSVRLYKAETFPYKWTYERTLITLPEVVDATPLYYANMWWLFTSISSHDTLRLFHSKNLTGPWEEHPYSPVVKGNRRAARPGGKLFTYDGRLFRLAQDAHPCYGSALRVFEILELSIRTYREREVTSAPLLRGTGKGWNRSGMHHADLHQISKNQWLAAVDGFSRRLEVGLRF